jgi:hypothetical protein
LTDDRTGDKVKYTQKSIDLHLKYIYAYIILLPLLQSPVKTYANHVRQPGTYFVTDFKQKNALNQAFNKVY